MAEKQLLQTRLKSFNSLLDNNAKQLELTRSKIASILTPPNYQECQDFIEKIKEKRLIQVRQRQVRKLNNLINKMEGNITWQSSQVLPATRASPQTNNRQAGNRVQAGNSTHTGNSIQAGKLGLTSSPQASQPSLGERAPPQSQLSQTGSSQASSGDSSLSVAESEISQAGSSQAFPEDNTLSPAESELSMLAIPRPLWQIAYSQQQRVRSSRQAVPSLPQKITLSHRQRVHSPRQAVPKLPQQITFLHGRE